MPCAGNTHLTAVTLMSSHVVWLVLLNVIDCNEPEIDFLLCVGVYLMSEDTSNKNFSVVSDKVIHLIFFFSLPVALHNVVVLNVPSD